MKGPEDNIPDNVIVHDFTGGVRKENNERKEYVDGLYKTLLQLQKEREWWIQVESKKSLEEISNIRLERLKDELDRINEWIANFSVVPKASVEKFIELIKNPPTVS